MRGLALVIELLAQPVGDFGMDLGGRDRPVITLVKAHCELQLTQVGLHSGSHVGVLQFAGERGAVERPLKSHCAMHLAQGGGARGGVVEALEATLPVRPQFAHHAAAHKGPAHRRRVGL